MSTTASDEYQNSWAYSRHGVTRIWMDEHYATVPGPENKLTLVRNGKQRFVVKRQWGTTQVTFKCGYPEAQRRFAMFVITRRLMR